MPIITELEPPITKITSGSTKFINSEESRATIVNGLGRAEMRLYFGLAEEVAG